MSTEPPVVPYLTVNNAEAAIAFYTAALGAEERSRQLTPDGRIIHADLLLNGGHIYLSDDFSEQGHAGTPDALGGTPVMIHLSIADIELAWQRALDAGVTVTLPLQDMFWGSRYGQFTDPFGHKWTMGTPMQPTTQEDRDAGAAAAFNQ